ncbi:MAG: hypothetical protein H6702_03655 [Myxococcales bacterium]|nr:hypothetical protein [Myxococcales bacterium]
MTKRNLMTLAGLAAVALMAAPAQAQIYNPGSTYNWYSGDYFGSTTFWWPSLVGRDLNGVGFNGDVLDGQRIAFVEKAASVDKKGRELDAVEIVGTRLAGQNVRGDFLGPKGMVGASFVARTELGGAVELHIEEMGKHPEKRIHRDVVFYLVTYQTDEGRVPLCGLDEDGSPVGAIAMEGYWDLSEGTETGGDWIADPDRFTFACDGHALAHCALAGYKPWRRVEECRDGECEVKRLREHHQACVRMLRADYCGDGTAHTQDGVAINHYDAFGIRTDSEDWTLGAEWDANGARCMNQERVAGLSPACAAELVAEDCGAPAHFASGTLLMSEHEPR